MHESGHILTVFIVISVMLFMLLGIAILVMIDHKARIPGEFNSDPFSITGLRREHPFLSFLTTFILGAVILSLLFEISVAFGEKLGFFEKKEKPELLQELKEHRFSEEMRHFHNVRKNDTVNAGKKPVCFYCHGDYPHSKTRMIRTLLNMHTQFVGCMTCHTNEKKVPEDSYSFAWLNYSGIKVKGPHFGTSLNPDTGYLVKTDDYFSKIVVYADIDGKKTLMEMTEAKPEVKEFLAVKDRLSDSDKEAMKKRIHKLVRRKGRFCDRCHAQEDKSYLPFRKLGFSEQRIFDVTNLNIIGIVKKYKNFYLPNLFKKESGKHK
ncbi:hypothetical protein MNBD_GAMMA24-2108 [hydrothermal vent metagenome]|uniref:Cytochrome c-552/4 domain-containing protein n=1 Tax=hydrothermal vent metagenome TaxID=652676 RepID=A0A3B1BFY8_9ZZZZ